MYAVEPSPASAWAQAHVCGWPDQPRRWTVHIGTGQIRYHCVTVQNDWSVIDRVSWSCCCVFSCIDVGTRRSYDASCLWRPRLLCGSREDLEQPAVWSHVDVIFVHVQAPTQDTTCYQKLSRQPPPYMTNCFRHVPRIPSFRLTLLGVLAVILTLRHLNQFFDEWMNEFWFISGRPKIALSYGVSAVLYPHFISGFSQISMALETNRSSNLLPKQETHQQMR